MPLCQFYARASAASFAVIDFTPPDAR